MTDPTTDTTPTLDEMPIAPTTPPTIRIWPDEDDFDSDDSVIVFGRTDLEGATFWSHQHLVQESPETAETWLLSEILRVNGEKLSPLDIETAPWLNDECYTACLAHIGELNKWMSVEVQIRAKETDHGLEVWRFDDSNCAIVAVDSLSRETLREYQVKARKNQLNAQKWGLSQAFRIVNLDSGEVSPLSKAYFPKFNGSICEGGNREFTWDCWALLVAYFFKRWFKKFLTR
jgi:hypothetical protein